MSFSTTPDDGPAAGKFIVLVRHYEAFATPDGEGLYVWSPIKEAYVWRAGLKMEQWLRPWKCTNPACRRRYAEYINGCPTCCDEETGKSWSVIFDGVDKNAISRQ
jgi:hypothetical protein